MFQKDIINDPARRVYKVSWPVNTLPVGRICCYYYLPLNNHCSLVFSIVNHWIWHGLLFIAFHC